MDVISKLQTHRTTHIKGLDDDTAAAALWGASDTRFTVSGVFRDPTDFAVLVLFQKDDLFGHRSRADARPQGEMIPRAHVV